MKTLVVPIRVDALVAEKPVSIARQGAHFADMPFQDAHAIDRQTDTANLATSISYRPFSNEGTIQAGVHLHWAMPDALTQGKVKYKDTQQALRMPTVPDRWLVVRRDAAGKKTDHWLVESDYLHPKETVPDRAVCVPMPAGMLAKGDPPYRYLGRQQKLTDLSSWQEDNFAERYPDLNALGWGNPFFGALYGECFSVFGAYDSSKKSKEDVKGSSYEVIGWYANADEDYLQAYLQAEMTKQPGVGFQEVLKELADWEVDTDQAPQRMICYGRIAFDADPSMSDGISGDATLALATSGEEALATYLSKSLTDDEDQQIRIENQLEAVLLSDTVRGENIDFINRLKTDRHKKSFSQVDGGSIWAFIDEGRIPVIDQEVLPNAFVQSSSIQSSGILRIAGKQWVLSFTAAQALSDHVPTVTFSGTAPASVSVENQQLTITLGGAQGSTTVGQLKTLLEGSDEIRNVTMVDDAEAELIPNGYDVASQTLVVYGKKWTLWFADGQEGVIKESALNISLSTTEASNITIDKGRFSIRLDQNRSVTVGDIKALLEANNAISAVSAEGDEQKHKTLTQTISDLKERYADELQQLNQWQFELNQINFALEGQRELLFSDWSKYMLTLYPVDRLNDTAYPDNDQVKQFIDSKTLPVLDALEASKQNLQQHIKGQLDFLQEKWSALLERFNTRGQAGDNLVRSIPAPRFWQPNEPTVLISGNVARPTDRHGEDGTLACDVIELEAFTLQKISDLDLEETQEADRSWKKQPWNPIMMEWDVAVYPDHQSIHNSEDQLEPYDPEFIKRSYRIPLNDAAYALPSAAVDIRPRKNTGFRVSMAPNIVRGRSILTGGVSEIVKKELQGYLHEKEEQRAEGDTLNEDTDFLNPIYTVEKAKKLLEDNYSLTQQLSGLHDEYLMQRSGLSLPVEDPHRFIDKQIHNGEAIDQFLTGRVQQALGSSYYKLPATGQRFMPIYSGIVRLNQIRIVDTFGRYRDLPCEHVLRPQRQLFGNTLYLPPRLVQPARLNLRWHMLPKQRLEALGYHGRTPVCGWLVYNYFDETLVMYNTVGEHMGAINSDGELQSEEGTNYPDTAHIGDPTLKAFVNKLRSFHPDHRPQPNSGNDYLPQLKQAIRKGQENINPEAYHLEQDFLTSRPLAVVRAGLDLQLKGSPEINKSWRALFHDINATGVQRTDRRFTAVEFPIKIGEYKNFNDGLICYWTQDSEGNFSNTGYFPQSNVQDIADMLDAANFDPDEHDYIDAIKEEGVANLRHSLEAPPMDLVILMEPDAPVHATTGIVPKKVLRLEPPMYRDALNSIQQTYFGAPLLTPTFPEQRHALPLPSGDWQWRQRYYDGEGTQFLRRSGLTMIGRPQFLAQGGTEEKWDQMVHHQLLRPDPNRADHAFYFPPDAESPTDGFDTEEWKELQQILEKSQRPSLTPLHQVAPPVHRVEAVEGYFKKIAIPEQEDISRSPRVSIISSKNDIFFPNLSFSPSVALL